MYTASDMIRKGNVPNWNGQRLRFRVMCSLTTRTGTEMMLKFTYCKNFAHAETRESEWDDFAEGVSKSVGYAMKEESIRRAAIVGGLRECQATP